LQALLPTIRKEKGCRECRTYRDVEDGEVFFLSAHWEAQANLEHYIRSTNGMALLGAIDVLSERAAVKTGHDEPWEGIDVLKRIGRRKRLLSARGGGNGLTPHPSRKGRERKNFAREEMFLKKPSKPKGGTK
jgi:quinol monooxygenase YgiN